MRMFGHSLGGATAAEAMGEDPRIAAGVDLDGTLLGAVVDTGLDRPFLLFGSAQQDSSQGRTDPSWHQFWTHLRGWRQKIVLVNGGHLSFTDLCLFGGPGEAFDAASTCHHVGTGCAVFAPADYLERRWRRGDSGS